MTTATAEVARREHILVVGSDPTLRVQLADTLAEAGGYHVTQAASFEDALGEILLAQYDVIVTQTELPDLSGMDLLAVVGSLRPETRVIIIDDDLSPRSAVAVYRLGASDYLYRPLNLSFFLMQVERQIEAQRAERRRAALLNTAPEAVPGKDRTRRLDPRQRAAALVLNRTQFDKINVELSRLLGHVRASFVGLVDGEGNMVGAAGTLEDYNLQLLTHALNIDHRAQRPLADLLEERKFHSTYFEGERNGVYIIEFGAPYTVALAVICGVDVKPGMVWLYSKRAANLIDEVLRATPLPKALPSLG